MEDDLKFSSVVLLKDASQKFYLQVLEALQVTVKVMLLEAVTHRIPLMLWRR